jgi:myo-inositol-1(or 4)-monophosphatase
MADGTVPSLAAVEAVCDEAAALVRTLLQRPVGDWRKGDASPVTTIDLAVDRFLHERLRPLMPEAGWLSEETADEPSRLQQAWLWVVDPIDGTRSLLARKPEFCISVALVHSGVGSELAVIGNPSTGQRWSARRGHGAHDRGGRRLTVRSDWQSDRVALLVSRTDVQQGLWEGLAAANQLTEVGSLAYKMALVASGDYDGHATPTPRNEWDAAAGQLLIDEAGGVASDLHGAPLRFNQPQPNYDGFVVASRAAYPHLLGLARHSAVRWLARLAQRDGQ